MSPVFIVGEARSGTTILYRSLQSHPSFTPRGGLHLVESHAMELLVGLIDREAARPQALVDFLMGDEPFDRFLADIAPLNARRRLARRTFPGRIQRPPVWAAAGEHHVVRRYFLEACESRAAVRLLEKTPQHLHWVNHLRIAFPRARFLYLVRHPVDVLASFTRRYQIDPEGSEWADIDTEALCERWRTNIRKAQWLTRHNWTNFLTIRYEDLTERTEPTIRRVLTHVREPYDSACLLEDAEEGRSWAIDPQLFEPLTTSTHQWGDYVSVDIARRVELELRDDMAAAGYQPYTSPD